MRRVAVIAWLGAGSAAASLAACQAIFPTDHFVSTGATDASSDVATDAPVDVAPDASSPDAPPEGATCTPSPTDPRNCGRCGHDCRGGGCVDGGCQPFLMASFPFSAGPGFVAVDTNNVYWGVYEGQGGQGGAYTCPKTGCPDAGPTQLVYDGTVIGVAVDGHQIYWAQNGDGNTSGGILACALDAGPCDGGNAQLLVASGAAQGVAVDPGSTALFWTTNPATMGNVQLPGSVYTCPNGGCSSPPPIATDDAGLEGIAVAGNGLPYWVDRNGVVMTCAQPACLSTMVVASGGSQSNIAGLAADDASVYWGNWGTNPGLYTCPLAGCSSPSVLLPGLPVWGIAVDDQAFYWTSKINTGPVQLWSMVR